MPWGQPVPIKRVNHEKAVIARWYFKWATDNLPSTESYGLIWDASAYVARNAYRGVEYDELEPRVQRLISTVTKQFHTDGIITKTPEKIDGKIRRVARRGPEFKAFQHWLDHKPTWGVAPGETAPSIAEDYFQLEVLLGAYRGVKFGKGFTATLAKFLEEKLESGELIMAIQYKDPSRRGEEKVIYWEDGRDER